MRRIFRKIKRFLRNLKDYYPILKEDEDWDYGFLLDLLEFKLKKMGDYFHSTNIIEREKTYGDYCYRLVGLLEAGYKSDKIIDSDLENIYVNDRNMNRFLNEFDEYFVSKHPEYKLGTIRQQKAIKIFWKCFEYYIEYLWD